jgi:hypothetical protein
MNAECLGLLFFIFSSVSVFYVIKIKFIYCRYYLYMYALLYTYVLQGIYKLYDFMGDLRDFQGES